MGSVTDASFIESPLPPRSWVTLGPQYAWKEALSRMKEATMRTAMATLLWQIFFPNSNGLARGDLVRARQVPEAHLECRPYQPWSNRRCASVVISPILVSVVSLCLGPSASGGGCSTER